MQKQILSTDALDAFRTIDGIVLQEKNEGAKRIGVILLNVGIFSVPLSFIPFDDFPVRWMATFIPVILFYGGIIGILSGGIYWAKGKFKLNERTITFDKNRKELILKYKTIPFKRIQKVSYTSNILMDREYVRLRYTYDQLPAILIPATIITDSTQDIENLVNELNAMIKDTTYTRR